MASREALGDYGNLLNPAFWRLSNARYLYTNAPVPDTALKQLLGPVKNSAGSTVYLYRLPGDNPPAWVAPAPGFFQVGLATNDRVKPDLKAFLAHTEPLFGFSAATVKERRSGLIPCGGPVTPFAATRVLLIGDAAGHVSPLTGGGIRLAFRYGRRAGQLIADHLTRNGPPPEQALKKELPGFGKKLALRTVMDIGPPNWLYNIIIGTPPMRWFANSVYFHRRYTGSATPQSGAED